MMKNILLIGLSLFLFACGSLESRIKKDMKEHCECVTDKGMDSDECSELMKAIILRYQDEDQEDVIELIRIGNMECDTKMKSNGKDDTSIRVR